MEGIELLHIGDIHYDFRDTDATSIDLKDQQFPEILRDILPEMPYQIILKDLSKELFNYPEALLMSGDLSTYGNMDIYRECLEFIKERVPPNYLEEKNKLFLAPGNHDIDHTLFSRDSLFQKFDPILNALAEKGFPKVPVNKIESTELKTEYGTLILIIINSCLGCGERRYYPEELQEVIFKYINARINSKKNYEDIDTPIFQREDIDSIIDLINSKDKSYIPIILTHHNLLTMRKLRIAMYTELINSGYMREKLLSLGRPILYLHGHIHDNDIEIIQSPIYEDSKIICISAPLLMPIKNNKNNKFGFNKIKLVFSQSKRPIGCEIEQFKFEDGRIKTSTSRIRFLNFPETIEQATGDEIRILELIREEKMVFLFRLREAYRERFKVEIDMDNLHKLIEELDWLGLVNYDRDEGNYGTSVVKWLIP